MLAGGEGRADSLLWPLVERNQGPPHNLNERARHQDRRQAIGLILHERPLLPASVSCLSLRVRRCVAAPHFLPASGHRSRVRERATRCAALPRRTRATRKAFPFALRHARQHATRELDQGHIQPQGAPVLASRNRPHRGDRSGQCHWQGLGVIKTADVVWALRQPRQ